MPPAPPPPFTPYGPWNLPIGRSAAFSHPGVADGYVVGLSSWQQPDEWSVPVYVARPEDPLRPVLYNVDAWNKVASGEWLRVGNSPELEQQILKGSSSTFPTGGNVFSSQSTKNWVLPQEFNRLENPKQAPAQFRLPADAIPARGWDGHIAVYQPSGLVFEGYGVIQLSTGERVALTYNVTDPGSNGDGSQNGVTASMLPVYGGLTTEEEILSGHIGHAMKLYAPPAVLKAEFVYPALAFDRNALKSDPPYSGKLPVGGRLALPPDLDLASLELVSPEGETIAKAAKTHGFIIADRGGSGFSIMVEQNHEQTALDSWSWELEADLKKIFSKLQLVSDNFEYAEPTPAGARVRVSGGDKVTGTTASEILVADLPGQALLGGGGHDVFQVGSLGNVTVAAPQAGVTTLVSAACTVKLPVSVDNLRMEGACAGRTVIGNAGHNDIDAGTGRVTVLAGPGNDVIRLGEGSYVASGGRGHDIFRFQNPENQGAIIVDFTIGQDRLDLSGALHALGYSGRDPVKDGVLRFRYEDGRLDIVIDRAGDERLQAHTLATLDYLESETLLAGQDWFF